MSARDPERDWIEFWEDICTTDTGDLDLAQIKKELSDFLMVLERVPLVYSHVTGGAISKPNTDAAAVIEAADEHCEEVMEDNLNEALEAIQKAH